MPLASSHQRMQPSAAQFGMESIQPVHIARYCVVSDHSAQPPRYNRNQLMASIVDPSVKTIMYRV